MNPLLIAFVLASFLIVFRQFGGRLAAQRSLLWWGVFIFIAIAVIHPSAFDGVVALLGIQVTSNFILASLTLFALLQLLEESAAQTRTQRKLREVISRIAAGSLGLKPPGSQVPQALVVLPSYNEEQTLPKMQQALELLKKQNPGIDYCFVSDGSTDSTDLLLATGSPQNHCIHVSNAGVSGVLLTGFHLARRWEAQWVVQCDSDGQHPVLEIPRLIREAKEKQCDLLIGSRYVEASLQSQNRESSSWARRLGGRVISSALRLLFGVGPIQDPTSGFRVYSKRAIDQLIHRMPDEYPEPELLALAATQGLRVAESPVVMQARQGGQSSIGGFSSIQYMLKVLTALTGLRLRALLTPGRRGDKSQT